MTKLDPRASEFETTEAAEKYDRWFRAKVEAVLADPQPSIPHDQVMADAEAIIVAAERRRA
ncbi:hypothetical protein MASR1M8_25850 [Thermomonas brevis]